MDQAALAATEDLEKVVFVESVAGDSHGKAAYKLGFQTEANKVRRADLSMGFLQRKLWCDQSVANDLIDADEGSAGDEEDVTSRDRIGHSRRVAPSCTHGGLELASDIIWRKHGDVAVFHEFEEVRLDPSARDVSATSFG